MLDRLIVLRFDWFILCPFAIGSLCLGMPVLTGMGLSILLFSTHFTVSGLFTDSVS